MTEQSQLLSVYTAMCTRIPLPSYGFMTAQCSIVYPVGEDF